MAQVAQVASQVDLVAVQADLVAVKADLAAVLADLAAVLAVAEIVGEVLKEVVVTVAVVEQVAAPEVVASKYVDERGPSLV